MIIIIIMITIDLLVKFILFDFSFPQSRLIDHLHPCIIYTHSHHHQDDEGDDHDDQDDEDDQDDQDDQDDYEPALSKLPPQVLLGILLRRQTLGFVCKHKKYLLPHNDN